jgi:1,4-alpha-glucan branching enzyme
VKTELDQTLLATTSGEIGAPPRDGLWKEIFNSHGRSHGGSRQGNLGGVGAAPLPRQNQSHTFSNTLPPLAAVAFKSG